MRLPHGNLFPYSGGIAGHPAYAAAAHPAALAAHHAAAAAAWNNLKQSGSPSSVAAAVAAASAAAAGFQPRYWLHPHWPAAAVFDPLALAAHPEAGSSPPQHPDYTSFMLQSHQQLQHHHHHLQMGQNASHDSRSPASSPASSLPAGDSPTPELDNSSSSHNSKSPSVIVGDNKTILDLRVKIAGAKGSPSLVSE